MFWNYRVMVKDEYFQIHEVYYEGDKPVSYTDKPITISSDNFNHLDGILDKIKQALNQPVLHYGDKFPEEYV